MTATLMPSPVGEGKKISRGGHFATHGVPRKAKEPAWRFLLCLLLWEKGDRVAVDEELRKCFQIGEVQPEMPQNVGGYVAEIVAYSIIWIS